MSLNGLVLIGGGGHCKSVLDAVVRQGIFEDIVITDFDELVGTDIMGYRVIGNDNQLFNLYKNGYKNAFITVGSIKDTERRQKIYRRVLEIGYCLPNIIDPSAIVSEYASIGKGVFVGKKAVINAGAVIDDMSIINTGAVIEHDSRIGKFTHVSVGAVVCGNAELSESVFVGANATIIQGVKIGMNSIVGAGSVVLRHVSENKRVIGVGKVL